MKDLIILGAGGSGVDIVGIIDAINHVQPTWNIVGFLDDNVNLHGKVISGYQVLGEINLAKDYPNIQYISSIANPTDRVIRRKIWDKIKKLGLHFATLVHPSVIVYKDVIIKEGCVVNASCVLGSNVILEENVHLAYACNIAHETKICAHSTLGTGVNLSSGILVGEDCYIGAGVSATHDVVIEDDTLVAVGSAVVDNLRTNGQHMWIGVPAITIKEYMRNKLKK